MLRGQPCPGLLGNHPGPKSTFGSHQGSGQQLLPLAVPWAAHAWGRVWMWALSSRSQVGQRVGWGMSGDLWGFLFFSHQFCLGVFPVVPGGQAQTPDCFGAPTVQVQAEEPPMPGQASQCCWNCCEDCFLEKITPHWIKLNAEPKEAQFIPQHLPGHHMEHNPALPAWQGSCSKGKWSLFLPGTAKPG